MEIRHGEHNIASDCVSGGKYLLCVIREIEENYFLEFFDFLLRRLSLPREGSTLDSVRENGR